MSSNNWSRRLGAAAVLACGLCSSALAGHVYDFTGVADNSGSSKAFKGAAATEPPATNTVPSTDLTASNFTAIATSDDSRLIVGAASFGDNALARFVFTLTEPLGSLLDLTVDWEGNTAAGGMVRMYLWNVDTNSYTLVNSTSSTTDVTLTFTEAADPAKFIDGSTVTVLVTNATDNKNINTDYVKLTITIRECTTPADCDDGSPCTDDACMNFLCTHSNKGAGTPCGSNADTDCTNPDACNGAGVCQPNNEANGSGCTTDGNECTHDVCSSGVCTHTNTCCITNEDCDDGNPCTDDLCEIVSASAIPGGCVFNDNTAPCDDEDACTEYDVCEGGVCVGGPAPGCINSDGCCPPGCSGVNDSDCLFAACGSGQGDCCVLHANTGCQNIACCRTVCSVDRFCCDAEWDQVCVDEALLICEPSGCNPSICGDGIIQVGEDCDPPPLGAAVCCSDECLFEPAGVLCRAAAGACDASETCNGVSANCPPDFKSIGVCRPAAGVCDLADSCNGVSNACPPDAKSTAVCRPSTDPCDLPESCNGVSNTCPADFVITRCTNSDGCCPPVCNNSNDNDCPSVQGSAVLKWESVLDHSPNQPVPIALDIPDTGLFSESRSGIKKIVVTFDGPINPATAIPANVTVCGNDVTDVSVDLNGVVVSTTPVEGDTKMEIEFEPALPNYARYRIVLSTDIKGAGGASIQAGAGGLSRILTALQGDYSGDRRVNVTDLGGVRNLVGINPINPATSNEVRADVNNSGNINATDLGLVRGRVGQDARNILDPVCPSTNLAVFLDPDRDFTTTNVHDVDGDIVQFDPVAKTIIWTADGTAYQAGVWSVNGVFLAGGGFQVRFGTMNGVRRAYFTETGPATICQIQLGCGSVCISPTNVTVPQE